MVDHQSCYFNLTILYLQSTKIPTSQSSHYFVTTVPSLQDMTLEIVWMNVYNMVVLHGLATYGFYLVSKI